MKSTKNTTGKRILVSDLGREPGALKRAAENAIKRVLGKSRYILGEELGSFEKEFAKFCASSYAVGVASGMDALQISLMSLGAGRGDEVITAVNTAIPTAMAITACGATPRFVDVDNISFNMDPAKLKRAINKNTKAIIPVHLYGNPCEMNDVLRIAGKHKLPVVEDACQAHGASYGGKKTGAFGDLGAFSFYPTKNLGCYGDGGMIVTGSKRLADEARKLRNYGQSSRYSCEMTGINSRLDEVQAAVLRVKLKYLRHFNSRRIEIANLYSKHLKRLKEVALPSCDNGVEHIFHLYVIKCEKRDGLKAYLAKNGVESQIHYPVPLHLQPAFKCLGYRKGDFPSAERLSNEILSLPIFPLLSNGEINKICDLIKDFYGHSA